MKEIPWNFVWAKRRRNFGSNTEKPFGFFFVWSPWKPSAEIDKNKGISENFQARIQKRIRILEKCQWGSGGILKRNKKKKEIPRKTAWKIQKDSCGKSFIPRGISKEVLKQRKILMEFLTAFFQILKKIFKNTKKCILLRLACEKLANVLGNSLEYR